MKENDTITLPDIIMIIFIALMFMGIIAGIFDGKGSKLPLYEGMAEEEFHQAMNRNIGLKYNFASIISEVKDSPNYEKISRHEQEFHSDIIREIVISMGWYRVLHNDKNYDIIVKSGAIHEIKGVEK